MGRAPRVLWGWAPTETTVYEYTDGVLTASTTTREPEFDSEQVDWLIAYALYRADLTPDGFMYSETTSEDANPTNYDGALIRFEAQGPFTDYAVKARMDAVDAYREANGKDTNLNGLYWTIRRRDYSTPDG